MCALHNHTSTLRQQMNQHVYPDSHAPAWLVTWAVTERNAVPALTDSSGMVPHRVPVVRVARLLATSVAQQQEALSSHVRNPAKPPVPAAPRLRANAATRF